MTCISQILGICLLVHQIVAAQICSYKPVKSNCTESPLLDINETSICDAERNWLTARDTVTQPAWTSWLTQQCQNDLISNSSWCHSDANTLALPRVAFVVSGGGVRSILNGGGVLSRFESQNYSVGLIDVASYFTGVSGGAWLIGAMFGKSGHTLPSMKDIVASCQIQRGMFQPTSTLLSSTRSFFKFIDQVDEKEDAGLLESFIDVYGRVLSTHLTDAPNSGLCLKWSDLISDPKYKPLPMITGTHVLSDDYVKLSRDLASEFSWEFSPFASGHSSGNSSQFVKTSLLGSTSNQCVTNFDNFGFLMGLSSSAFLPGLELKLPAPVVKLLPTSDLEAYIPDPTRSNETNKFVDGGLFLNLPIWPMQNAARDVTIIIAIDSSDNTHFNYPNGSALMRSQEYSKRFNIDFPLLPATDEDFVSQGYANKTTFFGCFQTTIPMIVYIPNHKVLSNSNISSTQTQASVQDQTALFDNGRSQVDGNLNACIACAWAHRVISTDKSAGCQQCISVYCYNAK